VELIASIRQLEELNSWFQSLCDGLEYKPGSIFRIASQHLSNWGIEVTDENRPWIENQSRESYTEEWAGATGRTLEAISLASSRAGLTMGNRDLNELLADMAVNILLDMDDGNRKFVIGDIGSGTGETSIAILDRFNRSESGIALLKRCHFYMLEPAFIELARAKKAVRNFRIENDGEFEVAHTIVNQSMETHLTMLPPGPMFDMVVSNAVFHHMSFPTYLEQIHEKLADDGVTIIGDWHTTIWQHPAFVMPILESLKMDAEKIGEFRRRFAISDDTKEELEGKLRDHQVRANNDMVGYALFLADEFGRLTPKERLCFLEAHESLGDRLGKMEERGMCVDMEELREKHRGFISIGDNKRKLYPRNEVACVVAGGKMTQRRVML
jgi:SAM-dependent methyltransferase